MDCRVHEVTKSWTKLSNFHTEGNLITQETSLKSDEIHQLRSWLISSPPTDRHILGHLFQDCWLPNEMEEWNRR